MEDLVFDPKVKVSQESLDRKERFKKHKAERGLLGAEDFIGREKKVYFNTEGDITCFTNDEEYVPEEEWQTYEFTPDEMRQLINKPYTRFKVVEKDKNCKIVPRAHTMDKRVSNLDTFVEVKWLPDTKAEVEISLDANTISVSATKLGKKKLKESAKSGYQINNNKFLSVYITVRKNPNFMVYSHKFSLYDLAHNEKLEHEIRPQYDYTTYSLYSDKVFDSYARV